MPGSTSTPTALQDGLAVGDELLVLTWLHLAQRDALSVHPRRNPDSALRGVVNTRSPSRPNPIGLHRNRIVAVERSRIRRSGLEAIDKTPIVDLKSVKCPVDRSRNSMSDAGG